MCKSTTTSLQEGSGLSVSPHSPKRVHIVYFILKKAKTRQPRHYIEFSLFREVNKSSKVQQSCQIIK